jgi:hypothetical protein
MTRIVALLRVRLQSAITHPHFVPACLVLGTLVRLAWIWLVDADQVADYLWYQKFAVNIAAGKGYSINGVPTGYWPIGYPGFLGGIFYFLGPSVLVGKLANVVLYVGTIFLTYKLSERLFHSEPAARITLGILSFYPDHIAFTALLSSEILFVFLVALGVLVFDIAKERIGLILLGGLFFGMATLTKPQGIVLPLIVLLMLSTTVRSFLRSAVLIYGVLIATILPWMIRNYVVMGGATLANTAGINLLDGNNPYANGRHHFTENVNDLLGDLKTIPLENMFDGKEIARDARARDVAIEYIVHNPTHIIALLPRKCVSLFLSDSDGIHYSLGMMKRPGGGEVRHVFLARAAADLYYALMIVLFLIPLPTILRTKVRREQIGLAIIVYFTIIYLALFGVSRYHFPMMPWLAIYSGIGAWRLLYGRETLSTPLGRRR